MSPRLHVLLGAGGVGKTTLAAAHALALARDTSREVALLGIDPSRRLHDALGASLGDGTRRLAATPRLSAAILDPAESLRRWAAESARTEEELGRALENPFFRVVAEHLATATDVFAAARLVELAEQEPGLTDLVVDTAPGLDAIEFLTRPERVKELLGGRLLRWLTWFARVRGEEGALRGAAAHALGGLRHVGGASLTLDLADFFLLTRGMMARMLERVTRAEAWIHDPSTRLWLVTTVRDEGAQLEQLVDALHAARLAPTSIVLNRAVPIGLGEEIDRLEGRARSSEARALLRYARSYGELQARVRTHLDRLGAPTVLVHAVRGLDSPERIAVLAELGAALGGD